ncbi:P-loop containing nucleoside triphosphate hydrolase protein [Protomyces lactucae-debilis]|uniref:p-loop containing nucleoside triphosphate hydrolase protein n=1 Tax=Protomyces lactucae-debilis TaxID=2754530 RepID=A0A1Y2FGG7_PROLT|nr:P-loop containing nucleoside triphosphate hydrolase protein [Protomyces lactucae-debilis]ORY83038.1 P-loop containing nucleoside triphosphate hydrolase protein [Protomyces lactucae-debilis]
MSSSSTLSPAQSSNLGKRPKPTFIQRVNFLSRAHPKPVPDDPGVCPERDANIISRLFFEWMTPLMHLGYTRPLEAGDVWRVDETRTAEQLSKTLHENLMKRSATGSNHALAFALSDSHRWTFWSGGVFKLMSDTIQTLNTLIIRALIRFVGEAYYYARDPTLPRPNIGRGVGLAVGLFLMQAASAFLTHHFFYRAMITGALCRGGLISLIYKKSLRLSNKSRTEWTNGKITNLMSTDTYRIDFAAGYAHMLWTSLIQICVILIILCVNLGASALAGFGLLLISTPAMTWVVGKLAVKRKQSTVFTDSRVRLMQEILGSMRIIKFYAWEDSFLSKVTALRIKEMRIVQYLLIMRSAINAVAISVPVFATILAFVTYSLTGNPLEAATVFSSLTLFNLLRMPLMFLPLVASSMTDAQVSLKRIQAMLLAEEMNDETVKSTDANSADAIEVRMADFYWETSGEATEKPKEKQVKPATRRFWQKKAPQQPEVPSIVVHDEKARERDSTDDEAETDRARRQLHRSLSHASAANGPAPADISYTTGAVQHEEAKEAQKMLDLPEREVRAADSTPHTAFSIRNLNVTIPRGSLVAIVGEVGSGKSSLLAALVGEMRKGSGSVSVHGTLGFCAQVPWIMNATVRDNILFGRPFDAERYRQVVYAAALEPDFEILPQGDMTLIGERGITVSGGQKQRLNIARAAYFDADIILLDDPLSAVDAHVGNHLMEKCITGLLKEKTRILVTHQLHVLPEVDQILVVDHGQIIEQGSYQELLDHGQNFARILQEFGGKREEEAEEQEIKEMDAELGDVKAKPAKKASPAPAASAEERETGAVAWDVYKAYFSSGGGLWTVPLIVIVLIIAQVAQVGNNLFLSFWSNDTFNRAEGFYIGIYASLGVAQALAYFGLGLALTLVGNKSARVLHANMTHRILRAPMSFFDTTPIGRITNRFSKDQDTVDNLISDSIRMFMTTFGSIMGSFILSIIIYHYFAAALGPLLILFYLFALYYRASAREIKRLDAILRSSVFAQFGETLTGLSTVRAYGEQDRFIKLNSKYIDQMNGAYLLTIINQRWLGLRLDLTGSLLIFVVAILAVTSRFNVNPSTTGLVLSYTMQVIAMIGWMVRQLAEVENNMNSVERLYHYGTKLEQERAFDSEPDKKPDASWPSAGRIEFENVTMSYRPDLPNVLKGMYLNIEPGERVGIVGRTGAGKSSILAALYRISELKSGSIKIDGVDIASIGLHELRKQLSIIPQDPVMFAGTIRTNLDPEGIHTDLELWEALRQSHAVPASAGEMSSASSSTGSAPVNAHDKAKEDGALTLDSPVEDEGLNYSLGQRQLLALARALLRKSRVVVLDEATSSIDFETDSLIQESMARGFRATTVLCIAHRLRTIVSYEKVCVVGDGQVIEFGTPKELFMKEGAQFRDMCIRSGINLA